MIRKLTRAEYRQMPWKNGLGSTQEIAIYPADAGLDDFIWRVSSATVCAESAFSPFIGVDRSLAVVSGEGLRLVIDNEAHMLTTRDTPHTFSGETPVFVELVGGAVTDLNVMTRRDGCMHALTRLHLEGQTQIELVCDELLLFHAGGEMIQVDEQGVTLEAGETVWVKNDVDAPAGFNLTSHDALLYVIRIDLKSAQQPYCLIQF